MIGTVAGDDTVLVVAAEAGAAAGAVAGIDRLDLVAAHGADIARTEHGVGHRRARTKARGAPRRSPPEPFRARG